MSLDKQIVIRTNERDRALWERYAADRNLTVSDLVRDAVKAYCEGSVGISFSPSCIYAPRHTPGFTCPGCGGSARHAA